MTVFWTVLSGVSVYVIGQIVLKFFVDPLHAQQEVIGKIIDFLIQHETHYSHPGTEPNNPMIQKVGTPAEEWRQQLRETKTKARTLASELIVRTHAVPAYGILQRTGLVLTRADIRLAHTELRDLSLNLLNVPVIEATKNAKRVDKIKSALKIEPEFQTSPQTSDGTRSE
jgi:hypothetical protein